MVLDHATLVGNLASEGGGVYLTHGSAWIHSSLLANNWANVGPNLYLREVDDLSLLPGLATSSAVGGAGIHRDSEGMEAPYEPPTGLLTSSPMFYDDAYLDESPDIDWHLRPSSPAIDGGDDGVACLDQDLATLIPCLDPDGGQADLGAWGGPHSGRRDGDEDGLPDDWELAHGLSPEDGSDALLDEDGDGLSVLEEITAGTDPELRDSDGDGLSDGDELVALSDPRDPTDPGLHPERPRTLYVPGDYATLAEALEAAGRGTTIYVAPGIYSLAATVGFRSVRIIGEGSGEDVLILGPGHAPALTLDRPSSGSKLENLTLSQGPGASSPVIELAFGDLTLNSVFVEESPAGVLSMSGGMLEASQLRILGMGSESGSALALNGTRAALREVEISGWSGGEVSALGLTEGELDIQGGVFEENSGWQGGAVRIVQSGVSLRDVVFRRNQGSIGGGLYHHGGSLDLERVIFDENGASGTGGGLYAAGDVRLHQVSILRNHADSSGGGAYLPGLNELSDVTVGQNHAGGDGGGLYLRKGSLRQSVIEENVAEGSGGGLFQRDGSSTELVDISILGNVAGEHGGGVCAASGLATQLAAISLEGAFIAGNRAGGNGGGVYVSKGTAVLRDVQLLDNHGSAGGGLYFEPGTAQGFNVSAEGMDDVLIRGNTAINGGGLYGFDLAGTFEGVSFQDNVASGDGGGAVLIASSLQWIRARGNQAASGGGIRSVNSNLKDLLLVRNHATGEGGGVAVVQGGSITRAWLSENSSDDIGGGLVAGGSSADLSHIAVIGNVARAGGGLYLRDHRGAIQSMGVIANIATGGVGGGLYLGGEMSRASGLIVAGNQGGAAHDAVKCAGSGCEISTSVIDGGIAGVVPGEGFLLADPQLLWLPPAGSSEGVDLHLEGRSPAVDLGGAEEPVDFDGSPLDAGIYGSAQGALWDVDRDGLSAWYWPGSWGAPPDGVDMGAYDPDDLDSAYGDESIGDDGVPMPD